MELSIWNPAGTSINRCHVVSIVKKIIEIGRRFLP